MPQLPTVPGSGGGGGVGSDVNIATINGNTPDTNSGNKSAGTQRVVLATDQPVLTNGLTVSGTVTANAGTGTLAVSAASLPLPSGAATAAKQPTIGTAGSASTDVITVQGAASMTALAVSAASLPLPSGASTAAKQPALGTAGSASVDVITIQGAASMTKLLVTPDSVALPANQSTNVNQLAGTTTDTNSGVKSAGTLRVVLATDQPALTNKLLVTPDSVALPANQSVNISQINAVTPLMGNGASGTGALRVATTSDGTLGTVTTVSTVTNLSQLGGVAVAMNTGVRSTGTQRVTIATDDVVPASQSGTWTVQPGNTANTTAWLVASQATTAGGASISRTLSAANTTGINAKGSAGQVYGWVITNTNAAARFVKLYNKATAPTVGTDTPVITLVIPGNTAGAGMVAADFSTGIAFATGIGYGITTAIADNDTGAPAANEVVVNLFYK